MNLNWPQFFLIHISFLFSEWDVQFMLIWMPKFTWDVDTQKKKKILFSSPTLETYSEDLLCLQTGYMMRLLCQSWRVDAWLLTITLVRMGTVRPFLGPQCTYPRRHLTTDTRWLCFAQMLFWLEPQISCTWKREKKKLGSKTTNAFQFAVDVRRY